MSWRGTTDTLIVGTRPAAPGAALSPPGGASPRPPPGQPRRDITLSGGVHAGVAAWRGRTTRAKAAAKA